MKRKKQLPSGLRMFFENYKVMSATQPNVALLADAVERYLHFLDECMEQQNVELLSDAHQMLLEFNFVAADIYFKLYSFYDLLEYVYLLIAHLENSKDAAAVDEYLINYRNDLDAELQTLQSNQQAA